MEIIENKPEKLVLRIEANETLANAIRRSVSEIPTLAIDEVEIYKNDSALYDEMLALRLGLIPLKTEKNMNEKTAIDLKLQKKGPCTVYASDLKGKAEVVYPKIPITILNEEQELELIATAKLGKAIEHSKFLPGLCYYRHILEVKSEQKIDKIISNSKSGLIKAEKKGTKWLCDINEAEQNEIEKIDDQAIKDSDEILFIIESYGNMSAREIFFKAIESLEKNLEEFEKKIN